MYTPGGKIEISKAKLIEKGFNRNMVKAFTLVAEMNFVQVIPFTIVLKDYGKIEISKSKLIEKGFNRNMV